MTMKIPHRQLFTCLLALLVIVSGAVAGFYFSIPQPQLVVRKVSFADYGLNTLWVIASRNLLIGLQLLLGSVSFGIYSLFQIFGIGFAFGSTTGSTLKAGMPVAKIAAMLGPHTFIEFAGFILLAAIEFEAAAVAYRKLLYDEMPDDRAYVIRLAKQISLGFALIILAAIIEVYVTGSLVKRFD
jgi:uncharacterized membrane protein SpoIIM required for sporulation